MKQGVTHHNQESTNPQELEKEKRCAIPKVAKANPEGAKGAGRGAVDRTAVHRTKIMLPLGRMHKTPSRPFKAGTALNLDHEKRAREAEEPQLGLALNCVQCLRRGCGDLALVNLEMMKKSSSKLSATE